MSSRNYAESTVRIKPNLDSDTAEATLSEIDKMISDGRKTVVCDFSKTEYVSSVGLGILMTAHKKAHKMGGKVILCSLKPKVQSIFEATCLLGVFNVFTSLEEASKVTD